jgi:hypothetical protein
MKMVPAWFHIWAYSRDTRSCRRDTLRVATCHHICITLCLMSAGAPCCGSGPQHSEWNSIVSHARQQLQSRCHVDVSVEMLDLMQCHALILSQQILSMPWLTTGCSTVHVCAAVHA